MSRFTKLFASVPGDLKSLTRRETIFMLMYGLFLTIFSVINFNYVVGIDDGDHHTFKWNSEKEKGIETWRRVIMTVSGLTTFCAAMSAMLATKGKLSGYFWGIINTVTYGAFTLAYGYVGDAQLNILFFPVFQYLGIKQWGDNRDEDLNAIGRKMSWKQRLIALGAAVVLFVFFYYEIEWFSELVLGEYWFSDKFLPHLFDAITNSLTVVAQTLVTYRYIEQWPIWIVVNILQISLYAGLAGLGIEVNVLCMWIFFLFTSIKGTIEWRQRWKKRSTKVLDLEMGTRS